jgi:uncharacterized membrane protein (UPF0127 family)
MNKKTKPTINWKAVGVITLVVIFLSYYVIGFFNTTKRHTSTNKPIVTYIGDSTAVETNTEPQFVKHAELRFLAAKERTEISKIDIEIADNDAKRMQGLMYRKAMNENRGMLFIFPYPEPQNFWMKNTYISLDIIYVDENRKIVTIAKNTKVLSQENVPSTYDAQYVVEVNAGYCEKHGVKEGDYIAF